MNPVSIRYERTKRRDLRSKILSNITSSLHHFITSSLHHLITLSPEVKHFPLNLASDSFSLKSARTLLFRILLACLYTMLWVSAAFCQLPATLYFEHLTRENGLPSNEVNCAIQDNQGFVWIGTLNGLVRYDGHDMKVFHYIPEDSTSIVDNTVIRLMQAKDSSIWIGSNDGYSIYHPSTGRFTNYSYHKLKAKGFRIRSATAFYQDDDLSVWIGTNDGLFKAAPDGRVMKEFRFNTTTDLNDRHTFTSIVNKIYRDPTNDSCLLVTTSGGPLQFDKIKGTVVNDFGCIDVGIPGLWTIVTEKSGLFTVVAGTCLAFSISVPIGNTADGFGKRASVSSPVPL